MKKLSTILLLPVLLLLGSLGLHSCGEFENFSIPHVLSNEELEYLRVQDSIRQAELERINVDLLLEYDLEFYVSATAYDGAFLPIDVDRIAAFFGISVDELNNGISGEAGAPKIQGFAIEGSTHADNMTSSNTNAAWGHWWGEKGDVTNWGDNARVYAEYDPYNNGFDVGQMPGMLTPGLQVVFIECLKYQDKRVGIKVTVTPQERGQVTAQVVGVQQLFISMVPQNDYSLNPIEFDLDQVLSDLGVDSLDGLSWVGVNADGSFAQEYTADDVGYWYDKAGFVGYWGSDASVFTNYLGENYVGVGQMPDNMFPGDQVTIQYGPMNGNKIVLFEITAVIESYVDPETPPEGEPESLYKEIAFTKPYDDYYGQTEPYDVREDLRNAFKMTTYQISQALKDGQLQVFLNEVSEEGASYTGNLGEYWMDANGEPVGWSEGVLFGGFYAGEDYCEIGFGNHPGNCPAEGTTVITKMIIACKGVTATYLCTVTITAAEAEVEE